MGRNVGSGNNVSIGFTGLLAIVFITLKLCGVIAWSWWWVLSPIWGPAALGLLIELIIVVLALMDTFFGRRK